MNKKLLNGQIGLLLLIVMGIVVALVMSVASRSLSDTMLSRQERESSAAFSVAETGIENAMNELRDTTNTAPISGQLTGLGNFVTGNYKVDEVQDYSLFVREGETAHLDTTGFTGALTISWTRKSDPTENITTTPCAEGSGLAPAAIEVTAISTAGVKRNYYNPAGCNPGVNGFTTGTAPGGEVYLSKITYTVPVVVPPITSVRIKPIYAGATIVATGTGLTTQLYVINSRAVGGDAQKEIEVKRGLEAAPSVFDFALFTQGTIIK